MGIQKTQKRDTGRALTPCRTEIKEMENKVVVRFDNVTKLYKLYKSDKARFKALFKRAFRTKKTVR